VSRGKGRRVKKNKTKKRGDLPKKNFEQRGKGDNTGQKGKGGNIKYQKRQTQEEKETSSVQRSGCIGLGKNGGRRGFAKRKENETTKTGC